MSSPDKKQDTSLPDKPTQQQLGDRLESVDSAAYFEQEDEYGDYDDFDLGAGGGGGGGAASAKQNRRQENRGGGGSGSCYSAKHVRVQAAQSSKAKPGKK